jgi:hypothetical protein
LELDTEQNDGQKLDIYPIKKDQLKSSQTTHRQNDKTESLITVNYFYPRINCRVKSMKTQSLQVNRVQKNTNGGKLEDSRSNRVSTPTKIDQIMLPSPKPGTKQNHENVNYAEPGHGLHVLLRNAEDLPDQLGILKFN